MRRPVQSRRMVADHSVEIERALTSIEVPHPNAMRGGTGKLYFAGQPSPVPLIEAIQKFPNIINSRTPNQVTIDKLADLAGIPPDQRSDFAVRLRYAVLVAWLPSEFKGSSFSASLAVTIAEAAALARKLQERLWALDGSIIALFDAFCGHGPGHSACKLHENLLRLVEFQKQLRIAAGTYARRPGGQRKAFGAGNESVFESFARLIYIAVRDLGGDLTANKNAGDRIETQTFWTFLKCLQPLPDGFLQYATLGTLHRIKKETDRDRGYSKKR